MSLSNEIMASSAAKDSCRVMVTKRKEVNLSYTWRIADFKNQLMERGEKIESPAFSSGLDYGDEWCLLCYPCGKADDDGDSVAVLLWLRASKLPVLEAKFKISIYDEYDEISREKNIKSSSKIYEFLPGAGKGFNKFISRDELLDLLALSDGDLILLCDVTIIEEISTAGAESKCHISLSLSNQLGKFFERQEFGDITFIIAGAKIHAHKAILAARSGVFTEMFQRKNLSHHEKNEIPLTGVQYEAFKELLYFIYTDKAPNIYSMAPYLLILSDQYKIRGLKDLCQREIIKNLSNETAAQFLCVAEQSKSWGLKERIIKFITVHLQEIIETRGFRMMQNKYPDMIVELLRAIPQSLGKRKTEVNQF